MDGWDRERQEAVFAKLVTRTATGRVRMSAQESTQAASDPGDTVRISELQGVVMKLLTAVMIIAVTGIASAGEPTDYKSAYLKAQQGDKPLLVLVTADWCPPCQVMRTRRGLSPCCALR